MEGGQWGRGVGWLPGLPAGWAGSSQSSYSKQRPKDLTHHLSPHPLWVYVNWVYAVARLYRTGAGDLAPPPSGPGVCLMGGSSVDWPSPQ